MLKLQIIIIQSQEIYFLFIIILRYFYITLLREPISRYLSELRHVQRGATWRNARHWCGGREASVEELPSCYTGESWKGVTLDEFMACPNNLAHNRFVLI